MQVANEDKIMNKKPLGRPGPFTTVNGSCKHPYPEVVMIFATSLPRFKTFLANFVGKSSDLSCCLLFITPFLLPCCRRSVAAAARSVLDDGRNAGWLLRWL